MTHNWKRIVIKVGSALIAPNQNGCETLYLSNIANFIMQCRANGIEVILVSSGSVASGSHKFPAQKDSRAVKRAMAATGQTQMMAVWDKLFDCPTAQILLTHDDLRDRNRYESVRETLFSLLENDVLPIVNENDSVATENAKVGDNDNLSAMVAAASESDILIMCSDIQGLYTANPNTCSTATLVTDVEIIDQSVYDMAGGADSKGVGTGGMKTKIQAAEKATSHGIETFIVDGFSADTFTALSLGKNPGTKFHSVHSPMEEHIHWMTYTSYAQGEVVLEENVNAKSDSDIEKLTSERVLSVEGEFAPGDTILIRTQDGRKIAKAQTNYGSCLLSFLAEQSVTPFDETAQQVKAPLVAEQHIALLE